MDTVTYAEAERDPSACDRNTETLKTVEDTHTHTRARARRGVK